MLSHSCKTYRNLYTPHLLKIFSTTLHYLPHFLAFICPVQQKLFPVLLHPHRCNSTLSVWPCGQGSTQGRNRSSRTAGAVFIEVCSILPLIPLSEKKRQALYNTQGKKRTLNTKLTYLSVDVRALSVSMQVKATWTGVYSAQLILDSIEECVVSRNSWRLCSNGCAHAVER